MSLDLKSHPSCGLCQASSEQDRIVKSQDYAFVLVPTYPLHDGHVMVLPKRHVVSLAEFTAPESKEIHELLRYCQEKLMDKFPDAPPILALQAGKHASQAHIHYQLFPSQVGIRSLYVLGNDPHITYDRNLSNTLVYPPFGEGRLEEIAQSLR